MANVKTLYKRSAVQPGRLGALTSPEGVKMGRGNDQVKQTDAGKTQWKKKRLSGTKKGGDLAVGSILNRKNPRGLGDAS